MPGFHADSPSQFFVLQHHTADDLLTFTYPTLGRHEASSNIVLAHALKRVGAEHAPSRYESMSDKDVYALFSAMDRGRFISRPSTDAFWLTLWSVSPQSSLPTLDLILSCIDWTLGDYPIFLWTPHRAAAASAGWLKPRIQQISKRLQDCVPPERVFSVFGMTSLVKTFSRVWTQMTGFAVEPEPFYAALHSYCTRETFRGKNTALPQGHQLRKAKAADLEPVAQLCKEFADDSVSIAAHPSLASFADSSLSRIRSTSPSPSSAPGSRPASSSRRDWCGSTMRAATSRLSAR